MVMLAKSVIARQEPNMRNSDLQYLQAWRGVWPNA